MTEKPKQGAAGGQEPRSGLGVFQKLALAVFGLGLVGSVAARWFLGSSGPAGSSKGSLGEGGGAAGEVGGKSFLPGLEGLGESQPTTAASGSAEELLPFFTEASFFGLIGFGLGYASRKIIKLALVFAGLFFLGLQGLVQAGIVESVDWGKLIDTLNQFVFNLKENPDLGSWVTDRVPTAGALATGYFIGLKRG